MIIHNTKRGSYAPDLFDWADTQRIKTTLTARYAGLIQRYGISPFHAAVIAENLSQGGAV
jgi:hypothetical protein